MQTTRNMAPGAAALFDPQGLWASWQEASSNAAEQGTSWSREALAASLRLLEQGAAAGEEWARGCGLAAERVAEMARAAEHEVGAAADLPALWQAELDLLGRATQAAAAFGQDGWLALARQQATLMQAALTQCSDNFERSLRATQGVAIGVAQPAAGEPSLPWPAFTPPQPVTLPQMAEVMARTVQALFAPLGAVSPPETEEAQEAADASAPRAPARKRGARRRSAA